MHYFDLIKIVKERRAMMKVTLESLSYLSGVSLRTLKQFESGKGNPTLLTIQKLADALGLEVSLKIKDLANN